MTGTVFTAEKLKVDHSIILVLKENTFIEFSFDVHAIAIIFILKLLFHEVFENNTKKKTTEKLP